MKNRYYIIHISEINELKDLFISSPSGTLLGAGNDIFHDILSEKDS